MQRLKKLFSRLIGKIHREVKAVLRHYNNFRTRFDINHKKGRMLTVATSDMFYVQVTNHELKRYDMIVRYLAIENFYGDNNIGFDLYKKMQDARMDEGYGDKAVEQFKDLIVSYEKNGYDDSSYIVADKNLSLIDGSHRMALAFYHHIDKIKVLEIKTSHPVDYSIDWFLQKGFSDAEIKTIYDKENELLKEINSPFSCVIWDPAVKMKENIIHDLGYYGQVTSAKEYYYRPAEYQNIVRAIYAVDDIEKWKIDNKLEYMGPNANKAVEVELYIDDPEFRIKAATGMPLSVRGERAKKSLRERYKPYIDNYFFDIILHIGDNHLQSEYMRKVFDPEINGNDILAILNKYIYALTKVDVPYMPLDFPEKIPVGKDIDIICAKEDYSPLHGQLIAFSKTYPGYEIKVHDNPDRLLLRFELSGKLIFLIDCCCAPEGFTDLFVEQALRNRVQKNNYYILDTPYEILNRALCYMENTDKEYHLEYVNENKKDIDFSMIDQYISPELRGGITDFARYLIPILVIYLSYCFGIAHRNVRWQYE